MFVLEHNDNKNIFPESLGDLSSEFFSLDLSKLEASIMTIPLHKQIDLDEEEIGEEFFETFTDEGLLKKKPILIDTSGKTSIFRGWGG